MNRARALACSLSLAVASALASPAAWAGTPADPNLETIQVTATRRAEPAFDVPSATTIVVLDDIVAAAPQTVVDALRRKPGMFVQQTTPGQGVVIVRGLKGSEVLHVVDAFRLNDAIFRNAPNQYVALVDPQALRRIEAVRGPMSGLYGSDAMGGVVQMLTWEPGFESEAWDADGLLRGSYGSADDSTLARVQGALGRKGFVASGGFTWQDVNERRVGGAEQLPYTGYSARAGDFKLRADVAEGQELTLAVQYAEQPKTPRYDELSTGYGQQHPNSDVYWFRPQRRDFAQLRWRSSVANAAWDTVEMHLGRQVIQDDRETRDYGSPNLERERNRDTTDGLTFVATNEVATAHLLTWGADLYEDEVDSWRERTNLSTGVVTRRAPRFPDGSTMSQLGAFVADDWALSRRLDLLGTLRLSRTRTRLTPSGGFDAVTVSDTGWAGNLGVAFALRDDVRLVANLGRGFRAPNVFDLGAFGDRPGNRYNVPNPDLVPETVTSLDGGLKWAGARFEGELIGYYAWYRDKITSVLTGATTPSGRLVVQSQNATSLDVYGAEFGARYALGEAVEVYGNLTWTVGNETFEGDEYPADRIPPLNGSVGALWRVRDGLTADAWWAFAGAQDRYSPRDDVDPRIRPGETPGWNTWNLRVAWQATEWVGLSLQLANFADRRYREYGSGLDAPGVNAVATVEVKL